MSRFPDYLIPHLLKENIVDFVEKDLSNMEEKVKELVSRWKPAPLDYHKEKVSRMHDFARVHLSHFGVARAMAFALTTYAHKTTWSPKLDDGDVPWTPGNLTIPSLPSDFIERMH